MLFLSLIYLVFISLGMPGSLLGASWPMMHLAIGAPITSAGFISFIATGGTIISSLMAHRLLQRWNTGVVNAAGVGLMAIGVLGMALSPSLIWLMIFAVPLGLGAGAIDSSLNIFVAEHYQARHMNWLHSFWGVGAMLGPLLVSFLSGAGYSWNSSYFAVAILLFAIVVILIFSLPAWKRRESLPQIHEESTAQDRKSQGFLSVIKGKGAKIALLTFFVFTAIEANMALWGASYLVKVKAVSPQTAAGWVSLLFFGITAGRLLSGFASIKLSNQTILRAGSSLVLVGFVLLMIPLWHWLSILSLILMGLGLAPIFPVLIHETPGNFGKENAKAAIGLQMAFAYTGSTIMPPLLGYLYSVLSFSWMPYILMFLSVVMFVCIRSMFKLRKAETA